MPTPDHNTIRARADRMRRASDQLACLTEVDVRLAGIATEEHAIAAPLLPRGELADRLTTMLRTTRGYYEEPASSYDIFRLTSRDLVSQLSANPPALRIRDAEHLWQTLVWLLGPTLEDAGAAALAGLAYEEGLPSSERATRLAALARERDVLQAERERLVDTILDLSAGQIAVHHTPEVLARREAAAAARHQTAAALQRQRELAGDIDSRYAAAVEGRRKTRLVDPEASSRTVRSSYATGMAGVRAELERETGSR